MCLEKATERLLAWPPVPPHTQPHASVLERRADLILKNLQERTIPVVELKIPHILVCCQGSWPRHIFYFVKDLRKPDFPNPPIVFLHPNDPSAKQWGKVGIFKDVFFLKGSPIYELDLMRGGILQAGLYFILLESIPFPLLVQSDVSHHRLSQESPSISNFLYIGVGSAQFICLITSYFIMSEIFAYIV